MAHEAHGEALGSLAEPVRRSDKRTVRAVYWLNVVLSAEDRDLPGLDQLARDTDPVAI